MRLRLLLTLLPVWICVTARTEPVSIRVGDQASFDSLGKCVIPQGAEKNELRPGIFQCFQAVGIAKAKCFVLRHGDGTGPCSFFLFRLFRQAGGCQIQQGIQIHRTLHLSREHLKTRR